MAERRTFRGLRERSKADKHTVVGDAAAAFASIAHMEQGEALREYFAMIVCDTSPAETESAWRERQARRIFAEEILQMMDGGTDGGRDPGDKRGHEHE